MPVPSMMLLAATGGGVASITDSFNRANSGTLGTADTGQAWTTHAGTFSIVSNKASSTNASGVIAATLDASLADIDYSIDMTLHASGSSNPGMVFRWSDINNFFEFTVTASFCRLYRRLAGTFTSVGSSVLALSPGSTYTFRVHAVGSAITCYANGVAVISATNTALTTNTRCGIGVALESGNTNGALFDNLSIVPG